MRLAGATPRPDDARWLDHLPAATLAAMLDVGREVLEWRRILAKTGDTVVGVVLRHEGPFHLLDHYPKGDVFDPDSHAQWYYHAHDKKDRPGEHGHFHRAHECVNSQSSKARRQGQLKAPTDYRHPFHPQ